MRVAAGRAVKPGDVLVVIAYGEGMAGAAIESKGVNTCFGKLRVLRDINLSIARGEVIAAVYWVCTYSLSRVARRMERRVA